MNGAQKYIYFTTPYLIITDEMSRMMGLAAKRGVDVRIITPGIPDKKTVYSVTRSYYNRLVRNGVRIYEYTPGFCHAKMCVSDDVAAAVTLRKIMNRAGELFPAYLCMRRPGIQ